ncbi:MAG: tetratricopeptide repeat protein [Elusimicrobiota bacterium]
MRHLWICSLLSLLLAPPAVARPATLIVEQGTRTVAGYDEFLFLGWNDACSVAIQYFGYPPAGQGLQGIPDRWRIGSFTIPPDDVDEEIYWAYRWKEGRHWDRTASEKATEKLLREGYTVSGRVETIRDAPTADQPGLDEILHSTATFEIAYRMTWPPSQYRLTHVHYSPLGTCVFFVFRDLTAPRDGYRTKLARIHNPGVRRKRARAHATNGLLLYKQGVDLYAAEEELAIAVATDPDYPLGRYYHAMLLALHGRFEESLEDLKEAVARDPRYAKKAEEAVEFESLYRDQRFKAIVEGARP